MLPSISMSSSARYVTQSSAYDRLLVGAVLTDRRIAALRRAGYYRSGIVLPPEPKVAGRTIRRTTTTLATLKARYNL